MPEWQEWPRPWPPPPEPTEEEVYAAERIASRIRHAVRLLEFRGTVAAVRPQIGVDVDAMANIRITTAILVSDSERPANHSPTVQVNFTRTYSVLELRNHDVFDLLRTHIAEMWFHELAEGVRLRERMPVTGQGGEFLYKNPHARVSDHGKPWPTLAGVDPILFEQHLRDVFEAKDLPREPITPPPDEPLAFLPAEPSGAAGGGVSE
jgi:hypothetical protein